MADGFIEIETKINNEKAEKDVKDLNKLYQEAADKIQKQSDLYDELIKKQEKLGWLGKAGTKEDLALESQIKSLKDELRGNIKYARELQTEMNNTFTGKMKKSLQDLASKIIPGYKRNIDKAKDSTKNLANQNKKTTSESAKLGKSIFSLGKMFKLLVLRMVLRGAINQIKDGFNNLVQYSNKANESASMLKSSLVKLKNALAVAFEPILNAIAPMLSKLIDLMSLAANKTAEFFAAFSGQKKVVQATKTQEDYAKSLNDTSKASKSLAGFDTIQKLSDNSSNGSQISDMFEEVEISNDTLNAIDELKAKLQPITDAVSRLGQALKEMGKGLLDAIVAPFKQIDLSIFDGIINVISGVIDAVVGFFRDNQDFITQVVGDISQFIVDIITNIGQFFNTYSESIIGIIQKIIDIVSWLANKVLKPLWTTILQPLLNWLINTILPLLLSTIGGIITIINAVLDILAPIFQWVWDKLISPIIGFIVEALTPVIVAIGDNVESLIENISNVLNSMGQFLTDFAAAISEGADALWAVIKDGFKGLINWMLGNLEAFINSWIRGINSIIDAFNRISFSVPDWVPVIGGKKWGFNLPKAKEITLPRLATGAVVPANAGEFAAILGDNKRETEVVSPLSTMKQALSEALAENQQNVTIKFDGDLAQLIRVLKPYIEKEDSRVGMKLVKGV